MPKVAMAWHHHVRLFFYQRVWQCRHEDNGFCIGKFTLDDLYLICFLQEPKPLIPFILQSILKSCIPGARLLNLKIFSLLSLLSVTSYYICSRIKPFDFIYNAEFIKQLCLWCWIVKLKIFSLLPLLSVTLYGIVYGTRHWCIFCIWYTTV